MESSKPSLQKRIFWDVDYDAIDYLARSKFVIVRAFERGDVSDIRQVRRFYGDEKVKEALLSAKYLFYQTFVLAKNIFNLKKEDFRCYMLNQSNPIPCTY